MNANTLWQHEAAMRRAETSPANPAFQRRLTLIRAAGDLLAARAQAQTVRMEDYDPYLEEDARVADWTLVAAVDRLLALVEAASGKGAADRLHQDLDYRVDRFEEGDHRIQGLNVALWQQVADLTIIRALEQIARQPAASADNWLTAREVEARYSLAPGSARKAVLRGYVQAEKRGHDLMFDPEVIETYWGHRRSGEGQSGE